MFSFDKLADQEGFMSSGPIEALKRGKRDGIN